MIGFNIIFNHIFKINAKICEILINKYLFFKNEINKINKFKIII